MKLILAVVLVALASSVLAGKKKATDDKVKVAVYYESLCPDSKKFITQQLAPVWRDLRGVVKVKLVPFGKATHDKIDGKWQFTCQHGPDECYGNKVQSCILKDRHIVDTDKVEMIVCLMNQPNPDKSLETCANQVKKSSEISRLQTCADSDQGSNLLAANGDKTNAVQAPLSFVPTIIINEKFDQSNQDDAFTNLKAVVCRNAVTRPAACD